jgi:hypothetical protein
MWTLGLSETLLESQEGKALGKLDRQLMVTTGELGLFDTSSGSNTATERASGCLALQIGE